MKLAIAWYNFYDGNMNLEFIEAFSYKEAILKVVPKDDEKYRKDLEDLLPEDLKGIEELFNDTDQAIIIKEIPEIINDAIS